MENTKVKPSDLQELVNELYFEDEHLQTATLNQASLYQKAAAYRIRKMKARQIAEASFDDARTERALLLRRKYAGKKPALTERYLTDLVDGTQTVRVARDALQVAKRQEEYAKHLLEAYEHRRGSIKVLAQFIYVEDSMRVNKLLGRETSRAVREGLKANLPHKEDVEE